MGTPARDARRGVEHRRGLTFDRSGRSREETTMDLWTEALEEMNAIDPKQLNLEQRLRRAEVKALLVIAQELATIRERGSGSAG